MSALPEWAVPYPGPFFPDARKAFVLGRLLVAGWEYKAARRDYDDAWGAVRQAEINLDAVLARIDPRALPAPEAR